MKLLMIGMPEIIFIAIIVLLLFGGKKIPELMKGIGKGVRSFKAGMNDIEEEIKKPIENEPSATQEQKSSENESKQ
ncbi:MAG: twin-arginine translocase TatA/TatE family subunit [Prevotellaceae bacterium]|nr:twin-arginine translocase TatA/TatE family subunit [Candidatus Faecinaster equi]